MVSALEVNVVLSNDNIPEKIVMSFAREEGSIRDKY